MKNNEWNPNDWQGRRKDQVEYNNQIGVISMSLLLISLVLLILSNL